MQGASMLLESMIERNKSFVAAFKEIDEAGSGRITRSPLESSSDAISDILNCSHQFAHLTFSFLS